MFEHQDSDEPPPPSYQVSLETFDQKTQQGIQASLQHQDPLLDLWEEWDEAKFEANARAQTAGNASSSSAGAPPTTAQQYPKEKAPIPPEPTPPPQEEPAVRPLRIVKKSQTAAYNKAVEAGAYPPPHPDGPATSSNVESPSLARRFSMLDNGRRTPPPVFEPVGPSLDGPDYEEVVMTSNHRDPRPSSPMSVLSNEAYQPPALPPPPPAPQMANPRPNPNLAMRPAPPLPPPTQYQPAPRPAPAQRTPSQHPRRRIGFDPMSAYRTKPAFSPGLDPTPEKVDPSAFYNIAVSSHLTPISQRPPIAPTYRNNGTYQHQQEIQHPRPHHAATYDSFAGMGHMGGMNANMNMGMNMGRERPMSVMSTDSSYYPNPPVNMAPNRGWGSFHPNR